jgi:hypothetical protein
MHGEVAFSSLLQEVGNYDDATSDRIASTSTRATSTSDRVTSTSNRVTSSTEEDTSDETARREEDTGNDTARRETEATTSPAPLPDWSSEGVSLVNVRLEPVPGKNDGAPWAWQPLYLVDHGLGKFSLRSPQGRYVTALLDGNLTAYTESVGHEEIFLRAESQDDAGEARRLMGLPDQLSFLAPHGKGGSETPRADTDADGDAATTSAEEARAETTLTTTTVTDPPRSFALRTAFGKYIHVEQETGCLSADSDHIGDAELFTRDAGGPLTEGHTVLVHNHQTVGEMRARIRMLTTAFVNNPATDSPHVHEMYAAIVVNMLNELIYDVHVMTESDCVYLKQQLVAKAPYVDDNDTWVREQIDKKYVCVPSPTGVQPQYKDFFLYANNTFKGDIVLFTNSDIVFDETLHRIDPAVLLRREIAFVLSVQPPIPNSKYHHIFGQDCWKPKNKCSVGSWLRKDWWPGGYSWDSYVFSPPLPSTFRLEQLDIVMNVMGAENRAGFQFETAGITLYDPCYMVSAYHWHCFGGKMHGKNRVDGMGISVRNVGCCWYCPGIVMPKGYAKRSDLCRHGTVWGASGVQALRDHFKQPAIHAEVCCSDPAKCAWSNAQWMPYCRTADQLDCVIWEGLPSTHEYY